MTAQTLKKFFIYLLGLSLAFLVVDRGAAWVLNGVLKKSEFRFSKVYQGEHKADMLVMGNSRSVNAFYAPEMEKQLGIDVLHLGFNGMSMAICETVLLDYLDHNTQRPSFLVIEVTNMGTGDDQLKDQKLYRGLSPHLAGLLKQEYPTIHYACQLSQLYQFNTEMLLRCLFYMNKSDQSWINEGTMNADFAESMVIEPEFQGNMLAMDGSGWPALKRIIKICDEEDIELRLVISPYLPKFAKSFTDFEEWKQALRDELPDPSILLDYSVALEGYEYFADIVHINKAGGIKLLEKMIEDGVLGKRAER